MNNEGRSLGEVNKFIGIPLCFKLVGTSWTRKSIQEKGIFISRKPFVLSKDSGDDVFESNFTLISR